MTPAHPQIPFPWSGVPHGCHNVIPLDARVYDPHRGRGLRVRARHDAVPRGCASRAGADARRHRLRAAKPGTAAGFPSRSRLLAVPNDPTVAHNWLVDVPEATDFYVVAANLPADLQVWVYSPEGGLLRQSNRPGYTEEIVQVSNVGAGTYWIVVDSPGGDYNPRDPYTFLATTTNLILQPARPVRAADAVFPALLGSRERQPVDREGMLDLAELQRRRHRPVIGHQVVHTRRPERRG